jgi:uncharacterized membrane protein HdeD (DUF308 family)
VPFINVVFGAAIVALAPRLVPEPERRRAHLDLPGAITAAEGVAALVYAFTRAASDGWGHTGTLIALVAGIVLIAALPAIEK